MNYSLRKEAATNLLSFDSCWQINFSEYFPQAANWEDYLLRIFPALYPYRALNPPPFAWIRRYDLVYPWRGEGRIPAR